MAQGRSVIIAIIAALSAIICVSIFTGGLVDYKKSGGGSGITATGSASCDFESDLIVWRGSFSVHGDTPRDAYAIIKKDAELVRQYLEENQVAEDEMIFSSVNISQTYTSRYDEEGKYLGDETDGYDLTQSLTVSSYDIDKAVSYTHLDVYKRQGGGCAPGTSGRVLQGNCRDADYALRGCVHVVSGHGSDSGAGICTCLLYTSRCGRKA